MPLPLALLLVVAAIHGLAWSVATAPLQGPDEIFHAAYAQHLAETGHGPNSNTGTGTQSSEMGLAMTRLNLSPILGHVEGRPIWDRTESTSKQLDALPGSARKDGSGPNPAASYPPLYYAYEALVYRLSPSSGLLDRLFLMRLATVALFVLTVGLTWLVACELFSTQWARTLATALVALNPKLGFTGGVINPDMMLVAVSTAFLLAALRLVQRGPSVRATLILAALGGLGLLTHSRALFLPPVAVVTLGIALRRNRPPVRRALLLSAMTVVILGACTVAAVAWNHAHALGLQFGGAAASAGFEPRQFLSYLWQFYLPKLAFMQPMLGPPYGYRQVYIETFFGSFASLEINYRPVIYDALQVAAALGLLGLYTTVVVRWRLVISRWAVVAVCGSFVGSLVALLHFVSYSSLRTAPDPVITGRYLLPAIALYAAAITWVATSLPRRLGAAFAAFVLVGSVLLTIGGAGISLARFYG